MPGPRGGQSRSSDWRAKRRKLESAIGSKYQEKQFSSAEPSTEETREPCSDAHVSAQSMDCDSPTDAAENKVQHLKDSASTNNQFSSAEPSTEETREPCSDAHVSAQSMDCDSPTDASENKVQHLKDSASTNNQEHEDDDISDNSDSSSDEDDYVAHFLDEDEEEEEVDNPDPDDPVDPAPNDPDGFDPDDPDHGGEDDNAVLDSDDSEEDDDAGNFDLNDASLNEPLHLGRLRTKKETLLLQLALSVHHNWDYESLINNMKAINFSLGRNNLPSNKKQLWRVLHRNSAGIHFHAYCHRCSHYLGRKNRIPVPHVCGGCGLNINLRQVKCFVTLDVKKQLQNFLSRPGIFQLLQYRFNRVKRQDNAIEDVYDSERYQNMARDILSNNLNFSYVLNTDGFVKSTTSHLKIWPVLIRLNELPPNLRQKFMFLAGVWIDRKVPDANMFLRPIVQNLNRLATVGVNWYPDQGDVMVNSKFVPFSFTGDAEGRALVLNMQRWNGTFGCTFCLHQTVDSKYHIPAEGQPWPDERTDAGMRADMAAVEEEEHIRGHKGVTELRNLRHFDLRSSNTMDDLHPIYIGVTKFHTGLLLNLPGVNMNVINHRLSRIRPTTSISRKPLPMSKREKFHGTEWRNWLLFYGPVCLMGLIPQIHFRHFQMLSHAVYLLSQGSILPENTDHAEELLENYVRLFQELFGPNNMRYNVHVLLHLARSVRENGGLWCYSTFNFESWNRILVNFITSPKDSLIQMVSRHLLCALVYRSAYDEDLDESVREFLQSLLLKTHKNSHRFGRAHLLGKVNNRQPTIAETNLMNREQIALQPLRLYDRVIVGGAEYRVPQYNPGGKSDNTLLYTNDDTYCSVQSIAVLEVDGEDQCLLFVEEFEIDETLAIARHIGRVQQGGELHHIVRAESVISPAVKMYRAGEVYLVPLANVHEID